MNESSAQLTNLSFMRHGRYQILRSVGAGGQGFVLLAKDRVTREQVVLKHAISDDAGIHDEFQLLSRIGHPHVVHVHEIYREVAVGGVVLVEDFIPGSSFANLADKLSDDDLLIIAFQMMAAISHLHAVGLRHGDIKPANIMVQQGRGGLQATLIDFGYATVMGAQLVGGTPEFFAPEIHRGEQPTAACDWFALGYSLELVRSLKPKEISSKSHPVQKVIASLLLEDPQSRNEATAWMLEVLEDSSFSLPVPTRFPLVEVGSTWADLVAQTEEALASPELSAIPLGGLPGSGRTDLLSRLTRNHMSQGIAAVFRTDWFDLAWVWQEIATSVGIDFDQAKGMFEAAVGVDDMGGRGDRVSAFLDLIHGLEQLVLVALAEGAAACDHGRELLRRCQLLTDLKTPSNLVIAWAQPGTRAGLSTVPWTVEHVCTLLSLLFPCEWKNETQKGALVAERIASLSQGSYEIIKRLIVSSIQEQKLRRVAGGLQVDKDLSSVLEENSELDGCAALRAVDLDVVEALQQNRGFLDREMLGHILSAPTSELDDSLKRLAHAGYVCDPGGNLSPIRLLDTEQLRHGPLTWKGAGLSPEEDSAEFFRNLKKRVSVWRNSPFPLSVLALLHPWTEELEWREGRGYWRMESALALLRVDDQMAAVARMESMSQEDIAEVGRVRWVLTLTRALTAAGCLERATKLLRENVQSIQGADELHQVFAELVYLRLLSADLPGAKEAAKRICDDRILPETWARCLTMKGLVERASGDLDRARTDFDQAIALLEEIGDLSRKGAVMANRALCDLDQDQLQSAANLMREALVLLRERGCTDQVAASLTNLGVVLGRRGLFREAARAHREAVWLFTSCGDDGRGAEARASLGIACFGAGEIAQGRAELLGASEAIMAGNNESAKSRVRYYLKWIETISGRFNAAARWHSEDEGDPRNNLDHLCRSFEGDGNKIAKGLRSFDLGDRLCALFEAVVLRHGEGRMASATSHLNRLRSWRKILEKEMDTREKTLFRAGVVMPALRRLENRLGRTVSPTVSDPGALDAVLDILSNLNAHSSLEDSLDDVVASILELTPAVRAFVVRVGNTGEFEILARAETAESSNRAAEFSSLVLQRCLEGDRPIILADAGVDDDFGFAASVRAMGLRSIACFPLLKTEKGAHFLYLDTPLQSDAFKSDSLPFVELLAEVAAAAFSLAHRADENKRAKALAQESEARALRILESQSQELNRVRRRAGFGVVVGKSQSLRATNRVLAKAARSDLSILITGETGSGKELAAESIHASSSRAENSFVAINCATIPESLAESEFFGHIKGAFTGATTDSLGLLRCADGGTLFLDEIGELSLSMQAKLLRALEGKAVRPVGSEESYCADVRFVFATNREIKGSKDFRQDLYHRLSQVTVSLPALRERPEDIPLLVDHFMSLEKGQDLLFEEEAMSALQEYSWPGNVRELRNLVARLKILVVGGTVRLTDLPEHVWDYRGQQPKSLAETEHEAILNAIKWCGGEKKAAAKLLGISRTALYEKLKRLGEMK